MDHRAAPGRRARAIVLVGLLILGAAIAVHVVQRRAAAACGSASSSAEASRSTTLDASDGVIPDGATVSAFAATPAVDNLAPGLLHALRRAATAAHADGVDLGVTSGWRSPGYQRQLLRAAVLACGSAAEAARWVATPETSAHVSGTAVDIGPSEAAAWLSEHGVAYGLCQIYANEPWHYELRPDAVDDGCPATYPDPTADPRMRT